MKKIMSLFNKRYYYHMGYTAVSPEGKLYDGDILISGVNSTLKDLREYIINEVNSKGEISVKTLIFKSITPLTRRQYMTLNDK